MIGNLLKLSSPTHFATPYKLGHDKTFHLLEARRGRGKSYTMAYWALQCALKGVGTVANFHLNNYWMSAELYKAKKFPTLDLALEWCSANIRYVETWDEIMLAYDCLVLIDEVNRLFDAQFRSKEDSVPKVVFEWLQLSRRNKITLVFAAQSMDWLNTRVRQLFDLLWRAKKEMGKNGTIKRFWLYGADPWSKGIGGDTVRGADFKAVVPFDKKIYRLYNTLERIIAIPNESEFTRFFDVYQRQIQMGLVDSVTVQKPRGLSHAEDSVAWAAVVVPLRVAAPVEGAEHSDERVREERREAPGGAKLLGRHGDVRASDFPLHWN